MSREALGKCPICNEAVTITKISCDSCKTQIEGKFKLCKFCKLTPEQKVFIDVFIKCRGNIKEVEKELGVSYPTVKNRLEDLANTLGHTSNSEYINEVTNKEVLDKLNNGEITVDVAVNLMKDD